MPSELTVGWWFGTPRYEPFFRAQIDQLSPAGSDRPTAAFSSGEAFQ